jgi:solute carrier family 35 protein
MFTLSTPFYMLASSSMSMANKSAIDGFPSPMLLLYIQLTFTVFVITTVGDIGVINISPRSVTTFKKFCLVPVTFLTVILCNIMLLSHTNIETFIVLRASTPIALSVLESILLNRMLPSIQSCVSITGSLLSALMYINIEGTTTLHTVSYFWILAWYTTFLFDQIYVKHIVDTINMTTWDMVWYTNVASLVVLFPLILLFGDDIELERNKLQEQLLPVALSCVTGLALSVASFRLRSEISATSFVVIGNVCKFITVLINAYSHASNGGVLSIVMCIIFSTMYKQADHKQSLKFMV